MTSNLQIGDRVEVVKAGGHKGGQGEIVGLPGCGYHSYRVRMTKAFWYGVERPAGGISLCLYREDLAQID